MSGEKESLQSFESMYKEHYDMVYRYVRRMIRNNETAVEDLTQEVFFVAFLKWEKLKAHPNIPGFLIVVAQNKIKKWFEKQSRFYVDEEDKVALAAYEETPTGVDVYKMIDLYSSVEHTLSGKELNILRYYYEYGYTSLEMAKRLGITESCFKVRIARMKQKLKDCITISVMLTFLTEIVTKL